MNKVITNYTKDELGNSGGDKPYPDTWIKTNNDRFFNATWEKPVVPTLDKLVFTLNSDNSSYNVGALNSQINGDVVIPATYNDGINGEYPVTNIGIFAFNGCSSLTSVVIPDSVTSIESNAFQGCSGLINITIGNSVTSIGNQAFLGCSGLINITIGNSVTSIGNQAFLSCSSLTNIDIPNSVTSIESNSFQSCTKLISITIGEANLNYSSINGVLYNKDQTEILTYPAGKTETEFVISDTIISIGDYVFYNCSSLTTVTIPDSVTSIGNNAFYRCSSLSTVTIPNSVTSIGNYAFYSCLGLVEIAIPNSVTTIGSNAFRDCIYLTSIGIPNSVIAIGDNAFQNCSSLTTVTIPDSVTSIGNNAFGGCPIEQVNSDITKEQAIEKGWETNAPELFAEGVEWIVKLEPTLDKLTFDFNEDNESYNVRAANTDITGEVVIPIAYNDGINGEHPVTTISGENRFVGGAFYGCLNITSVVIPESVTTINNQAFNGCRGLTSIIIPATVTNIGDYAFSSCTAITDLNIPANVISIGDGAFSNLSGLVNITVDSKNMNFTAIDNILYNKDQTSIIVYAPTKPETSLAIPATVTSIRNSAFSECNNLVNVVITNSVKSIGEFAFVACSNLTTITIPSSVTTIMEYAFDSCFNLTTVYTDATKANPPSGWTSSFNYPFFNTATWIPIP